MIVDKGRQADLDLKYDLAAYKPHDPELNI